MSINPAMEAVLQKAIEDAMANENHFIARYLHDTGYDIKDIELVRKVDQTNLEMVFFCRPRNQT